RHVRRQEAGRALRAPREACPPWSPAAARPSSRPAGRHPDRRHDHHRRRGRRNRLKTPQLALRELRRLARLVQARLLALDLAGVAREVALALEEDAKVRVDLDERTRDAVTHRTGLAGRPATVHAHSEVVLALELGDLERRHDRLAVQEPREVILERLAVDPRLAVAWTEDHAGDGGLALAGAEVLRGRRHQNGFGSWAAWGCSGPA